MPSDFFCEVLLLNLLSCLTGRELSRRQSDAICGSRAAYLSREELWGSLVSVRACVRVCVCVCVCVCVGALARCTLDISSYSFVP